MKTIVKNISIEAIKFECLNDISDIIAFTGAFQFNYNGDYLACHTRGSGFAHPKLGEYVVKIVGKLLTLTEEQFERL